MYLKNKKSYTIAERGYITLISILLIGAIGSAVAISLILIGLGSSRTGLGIQQSAQARAVVTACVESALQEMREKTSYSGSSSFTLGAGNCTYTVTALSGQNRTITATGTVASSIRKLSLTITAINPKILVSSWQEIP